MSTGRTVTDNCEILVAKLPGLLLERQQSGRRERQRLAARVVLPPGVAVSDPGEVPRLLHGAAGRRAGERIVPEHSRTAARRANTVLTNAAGAAVLGRPLSGATNDDGEPGAAGSAFGERLNQLDMRFAKILKFGGLRTSVNLDLYNLFNSSTVLAELPTYTLATSTGACRRRF